MIARALAPALLLSTAPLAAEEPAERTAQAMLDALQEVSGVPGLGASVWQDGAIVWTGSAGLRDVERGLPVERDTRFRLASVSKLFTVTAAARLAEEGKLDLDAPVTAALPWLASDWPPITARQLAAHTSGLPHYQDQDADRGAVRYASHRDAVGIFADRPLLAAPGTAYEYSSWGYTLLGALIEEAARERFIDYVPRAVAPGLDIGADATDGEDARASRAYDFTDKRASPAPRHDFSYTWAGGGLMGSAAGVARFGGAMLADRVVTGATFDRMAMPVMLASGEPAGEDGYQVGFGWRTGVDGEGRPITFHNGAALGARSALVLWREHGVAAAVLSNASWTSSIERTAEMLAAPFQPTPPGLTPMPCPITATRFEGHFGDAPVSGAARFALVDGQCRGELTITGAIAEYFGRGPQPGSDRLQVIALAPDGTLGRAGLVTPYGIYDQRDRPDGTLASPVSRSRVFTFAVVN